ncbi:PH domain-containing protein [Salinispora pacifica]|uniref:PH domain-containing protein n=1 Tax=Salinispora pacifica TaxID=351187 RepID=UPI0009B7EBEE|nr:PH domain-containing protein [Salinispora pacifica]
MQPYPNTETLRPPTETTSRPARLKLRPPRNRIEKRAIALWMLHAALTAIVVLGGCGIAYATAESSRPYLGPVIAVLAAFYVVYIPLMPTWRYLVHRWEVTDEAVYALSGWFEREWRIIPISRIQSINTVKGPLQQLLRVATIRVTTASREGSISIRGLDAEVAETAAHRLTEITELTPGDAT